MRQTVSMLKRNKNGYSLSPYPKGFTGELYDLFKAHKGETIFLQLKKTQKAVPEYLNTFYELDIRFFGKGKYCLVGEFINGKYVDYIAERMKNETPS